MKLRITVHGVAYEVDVEVLDPGEGFPQGPARAASNGLPPAPVGPRAGVAAPPGAVPAPAPVGPSGAASGVIACPVAGTVQELLCKVGDAVKSGQTVVVVEAMKMNTNITAPCDGVVKQVPVAVGDTVREGETLVEFT